MSYGAFCFPILPSVSTPHISILYRKTRLNQRSFASGLSNSCNPPAPHSSHCCELSPPYSLHSKSSTTAPSGLSSASSRGRLRQPFLSPFVQADTMSSVKRRRVLVSGNRTIPLEFDGPVFYAKSIA